MASSDEAEMLAAAGGHANGVRASVSHDPVQQGRRGRSKDHHHEVLDELAQETKRVTLLDREEQQLKGKDHVSRIVFVFGVADDRKVQASVEQEFSSWRDRQDNGSQMTGVLIFLGQSAVSFLEGPTELLFKAVDFFHGLSQDVQASTVMPSPPPDMKTNAPAGRNETEAPSAPRQALISAVRVLYFTELHGVRTSVGWCSVNSTAKPGNQQSSLEDGGHEQVFQIYQKLLLLCLKVKDGASNSAGASALQSLYTRNQDGMPLPEEVVLLLSKQGAECFFTYAEFQKVFMKPFQLVLNSELLWPMAPALSY